LKKPLASLIICIFVLEFPTDETCALNRELMAFNLMATAQKAEENNNNYNNKRNQENKKLENFSFLFAR